MVQKPGQDRSKPGAARIFVNFHRKVDAKETLGSASATTPPPPHEGRLNQVSWLMQQSLSPPEADHCSQGLVKASTSTETNVTTSNDIQTTLESSLVSSRRGLLRGAAALTAVAALGQGQPGLGSRQGHDQDRLHQPEDRTVLAVFRSGRLHPGAGPQDAGRWPDHRREEVQGRDPCARRPKQPGPAIQPGC